MYDDQITSYSILVDGATHVYYTVDEAADAFIAFKTNCCGANVSTRSNEVKDLTIQLLYGKGKKS